MNESLDKSAKVAKIIETAAVKTFTAAEGQVEKIFEEASVRAKLIADDKFHHEIDRRIAEWNLRVFCDKNACLDKVQELFDKLSGKGFGVLENEINMRMYFIKYCIRNSLLCSARVQIQELELIDIKAIGVDREYIVELEKRIDHLKAQTK